MLTIGSLFSGIGGFELGLEMAGLGPVLWQCEKEPFCLRVLEKRWPGVQRYTDVKTFTPTTPVDLICGGFPCQDISSAGTGQGLAGSRSGLWFDFARVIESAQPKWVIVENVASGAKRWVDQVQSHLGELGYETLPVPLSAQIVGAPHIRRRIFIIAYTIGEQLRAQSRGGCGQDRQKKDELANDGASRNVGNPNLQSKPAQSRFAAEMAGLCKVGADPSPWAVVPDICRVDDGISHRVDRLRALGNAVVPQCAEVIGHMVLDLERGWQ